MRKRALAAALAGLLLSGASSSAQTRDPEPRNYAFVTDITRASALWVNPGAAGLSAANHLNGYMTFDRPDGESWSTGQYAVGLQVKVLGFGYRHDEFSDPDGFSQGDSYTLSLGLARGRDGLGVARTWRTVGDAEGSWEIGYVHQQTPGLSVGLVWRDLGSPEVRDTVRRERLVGALTLRPSPGVVALSAQVDYQTDGGEFKAFRIGGSYDLVSTLNVLALAQWDGDGNFDGFRIGAAVKLRTTTLLGGAGLNQGGDARTATIGADFSRRP